MPNLHQKYWMVFADQMISTTKQAVSRLDLAYLLQQTNFANHAIQNEFDKKCT